MTLESARVFRLGLLVGAGFGGILAAWRLGEGAPITTALLWALGGLGVSMFLAGVSALGVRLQRKDLSPPT